MSTLLFCPVRQDAETFELALKSHRALKGVDHRLYIDDADDVETKKLLRGEEGDGVTVLAADAELDKPSYSSHKWNPNLVSRIGKIRSRGVEWLLNSDYAEMFAVDSDVIVHPDTANQLGVWDNAVVSEVYWSRWQPDQPWLPQVWDFHPYGFESADSVIRLREKGYYSVHGLGACSLIHRSVFDYEEYGASYDAIPSLSRICWGEDRWFCIRAEAAGIDLAADTHLPPFHVYRKDQLAEARQWFDDGCHPGYFRRKWLTPTWEAQVRAMFR